MDTLSDMPAQAGSNSLPDLAARIKAEHEATESSVQHAIRAGELLLEAKVLVKHGEWLPWLKQHCSISERTAQLYMRCAKQKDVIVANTQDVADLTLNEAAALLMLSSNVKKLFAMHKTMEGLAGEELITFCAENGVALFKDDGYNPRAGKTDEQNREWEAFKLYLVDKANWHPDSAAAHVEWVIQRPFITVDEWLGKEGSAFRRLEGWQPSQEFIEQWPYFLALQHGKTEGDIAAELAELAKLPSKEFRKRKRRSLAIKKAA